MARTKGNLTVDEIVELYRTKSVNAIAAIDGTQGTNSTAVFSTGSHLLSWK